VYLFGKWVIKSIKNYRPELLPIRTRDLLAKIQSGDVSWEGSVPPQIVALIKNQRLFGYVPAKAAVAAK
jgi:hypothetical protein